VVAKAPVIIPKGNNDDAGNNDALTTMMTYVRETLQLSKHWEQLMNLTC